MSDFDLLGADDAPVRVDAQAAASGLADGSLRAGRALRLRHTSGRIAEIPAERVGDALRSGRFVLDTPEDAERREYARSQTPVDVGVTGAASLLRGRSLGLSELGEEALGIREEIDRMREANPTAATIGDLAGIFMPAGGASLLSGAAREGSALGRVARSAGGLAPEAMRLGEVAGARATRAIAGEGASLGRRVLARGVGGGVEGLVQGSAMEAGHVLTEEALGADPADVADRMIASAGLGAVLGGGLMGGGALLGEGLGAVRRSGREVADLMRRRFLSETGTELQPGIAEILGRFSDASAAFSGRDAHAIRALTRDPLVRGSAGERARMVIEQGDQVFENGTDDVVRALNDALPSLRAIREEATSGARVGQYARHMREGNGQLVEQAALLQSEIGRVEELARRIETEARTFQSASEFGPSSRRAQQQLDAGVARARRRLADAIGVGESGTARTLAGAADEAARSAEVMSALDELKQHVGRAVGRTNEHEAVAGLYDEIRRSLEVPSLWGEGASTMQRELNAGFHAFIQHDGAFARQFLTEAGQDGFERLMQADSARVRNFLGQIGTAGNETRMQTLRSWLDGVDQLNGAALANTELSTAARAQAVQARDAIRRLRSTFERVETDATTLNQWRAIGGGSGNMGALQLGGIGALALGPIGGAAGLLASPTSQVRMLGAIERMARRTDERIATSVRGFLSRGSSTARRAATSAARATRRTASTSVQAYRERIARLDESQDQSRRAAELARSTEQLGRAAPRVMAAVQARATQADAYLRSVRPRGMVAAGTLVVRPREHVPSRAEIDRFMRSAHAVDDPQSVIDGLAHGHITREGVEALRAVYPALYQRVAMQIMAELARDDANPTYQTRLQLGMLLGVPTSPDMTPAAISMLQLTHALTAPAQQDTATQRAPDIASAFASDTDRIAARRAS